jgi:hypothetical protein
LLVNQALRFCRALPHDVHAFDARISGKQLLARDQLRRWGNQVAEMTAKSPSPGAA